MKTPWRFINKCIICGGLLTFIPSKSRNAQQHEGVKLCEQNHRRFAVVGKIDENGQWQLDFDIPPRGIRR